MGEDPVYMELENLKRGCDVTLSCFVDEHIRMHLNDTAMSST
jgi:hypothetical protein